MEGVRATPEPVELQPRRAAARRRLVDHPRSPPTAPHGPIDGPHFVATPHQSVKFPRKVHAVRRAARCDAVKLSVSRARCLFGVVRRAAVREPTHLHTIIASERSAVYKEDERPPRFCIRDARKHRLFRTRKFDPPKSKDMQLSHNSRSRNTLQRAGHLLPADSWHDLSDSPQELVGVSHVTPQAMARGVNLRVAASCVSVFDSSEECRRPRPPSRAAQRATSVRPQWMGNALHSWSTLRTGCGGVWPRLGTRGWFMSALQKGREGREIMYFAGAGR